MSNGLPDTPPVGWTIHIDGWHTPTRYRLTLEWDGTPPIAAGPTSAMVKLELPVTPLTVVRLLEADTTADTQAFTRIAYDAVDDYRAGRYKVHGAGASTLLARIDPSQE